MKIKRILTEWYTDKITVKRDIYWSGRIEFSDVPIEGENPNAKYAFSEEPSKIFDISSDVRHDYIFAVMDKKGISEHDSAADIYYEHIYEMAECGRFDLDILIKVAEDLVNRDDDNDLREYVLEKANDWARYGDDDDDPYGGDGPND